jgi:hypothetical protein
MEHWEAQMFEYNKVYHFDLTGTYSFGGLSEEELNATFQNGSTASLPFERQLTKWFPELTHIPGCKRHDHIDEESKRYDAKGFTESSGCKFLPSSMVGTGRTVNLEKLKERVQYLDGGYPIIDIIDFPKIRVIFKRSKELLRDYPNGKISLKEREVLFSE